MPDSGAVLDDITVLELGEGIALAYCGTLLASLGARVIKIEPPAGEGLRRLPPFAGDEPGPERGLAFLDLNRGKESITLDLAQEAGRSLLRGLLPHAGVLVESFPPGVLAGWSFDFEALSTRSPGLIVASITPFGRDGPYRDYLITEIVAEALGGLMYTIGLPEREPLKIGGSLAMHNAGGAAFSAVLAAIWQRDSTGEGQEIEVSIHEATAVSQIHSSVLAAWHGTSSTRQPSVLLEAADGWASIGLEMGVSADTWPRLCALMQRPELADDPRFATAAMRRDNRETVLNLVREWVRGQPKETVYHQLQALRSIAGYVATVEDLYHSQQLKERGFLRTVEHPVAASASYPGPPFHLPGMRVPLRRAPLLGEQNETLYCGELGLTLEDLAVLRCKGVV
jgi:crotonobetainyl-CoA:carnitine CoA-transferase CaiB-like acyl-CoA transferase